MKGKNLSDFIKHLRFVHFSLCIFCIVLMLAFSTEKADTKKALESYQKLTKLRIFRNKLTQEFEKAYIERFKAHKGPIHIKIENLEVELAKPLHIKEDKIELSFSTGLISSFYKGINLISVYEQENSLSSIKKRWERLRKPFKTQIIGRDKPIHLIRLHVFDQPYNRLNNQIENTPLFSYIQNGEETKYALKDIFNAGYRSSEKGSELGAMNCAGLNLQKHIVKKFHGKFNSLDITNKAKINFEWSKVPHPMYSWLLADTLFCDPLPKKDFPFAGRMQPIFALRSGVKRITAQINPLKGTMFGSNQMIHGSFSVLINGHQEILDSFHFINSVLGTDFKDKEFSEAFPILNQYALESPFMSFDDLGKAIKKRVASESKEFQVFGVSLAAHKLAQLGLFLLICVQLYYLLHLMRFNQLIKKFFNSNGPASWIGVYPNKLALIVTHASLILLPIVSLIVAINKRPQSVKSFLGVIATMGIIALMGLIFREHMRIFKDYKEEE